MSAHHARRPIGFSPAVFMAHLTLDPVDPSRGRPGALGTALLRLFTQSAEVVAVRPLGPRFRHITLDAGPAATAKWMPGDKLQVAVAGLKARTFTPFTWDFAPGRLELLAHLHGEAPAADWARSVQPGTTCQVIGPRRSMRLDELDRPTLLFGDETSFGLALAMRATPRRWTGVRFVFEVSDLAESREVLRQLALPDGEQIDLIERRADGSHRADIAAALLRELDAQPALQFVLTGHAATLQPLTRALKQRGVAGSRLRVKAYWATGKTGLD